ncbi:MAG TPA: NAD-dependent epimerase/dehydratase family protein [Gaiellales bacterium]|nr:NAD-dependent epimerase/dehydratase family protein [Gaiellales bacterium]
MSRYLVTGCAGFIGSHLCEALLAEGDEVLGLDAFTGFYPRPAKERNLRTARADPRFSLHERDACDGCDDVLAEVDGVFHLAGQPGVRDSWGVGFEPYLHANLLASQRVFEAAAKRGARVVFASSSSVYGEAPGRPAAEDDSPRPISPYGVTKLACETLARAYAVEHGLDVVCLRYFSVYGPRQRPDMAFARLVASLLGGPPFPLLGSGGQVRDFTYVGDIVAATVLAMSGAPRGAVYNVGGGTPASLAEAMAICERLTGRRLDARPCPPAPGDPMQTCADTRRIHAGLGWQPHTTLAEGLEAQIAWHARGAQPLAVVQRLDREVRDVRSATNPPPDHPRSVRPGARDLPINI